MPVRNPYMKKSDDLYVRIKKAANSGRKKGLIALLLNGILQII